MRLKRLQTAAMVVMVIFFLINFYSSFISKRIFAILVFWDFLKRSMAVINFDFYFWRAPQVLLSNLIEKALRPSRAPCNCGRPAISLLKKC